MKRHSTRRWLEIERERRSALDLASRIWTSANSTPCPLGYERFKSRGIVIKEASYYMYDELEQKIREIIWRRWTSGVYPTLDDLHPNIYSGEIYDELIESGVDVPKGVMEQILKSWMSQGYIRTKAMGAGPGEKQCHGSMKIVAVYESLGR